MAMKDIEQGWDEVFDGMQTSHHNDVWQTPRNDKGPLFPPSTALDVQVGGAHYKSRGIQPVTYIHANGLDFFEGSAIKYITRWRNKGGKADLDKAIHFLEMLKELEPD